MIAMISSTKLLMTDFDYAQISSLLEATRDLEYELRRATIVSQASIPHDVVTMGSRVRFVRVESGIESEVSIVHPNQADLALKKISVLSPLGVALLGLRVGQRISRSCPRGNLQTIEVKSVSFQPEAATIWEW
jgi:regulator of nucleoside diphosphate kinase